MKKILSLALLSAFLMSATACNGVPMPGMGGDSGGGTGSGIGSGSGETPGTPSGNACTVPFPTAPTDLCTMTIGKDAGQELAINSLEVAMIAYLNEARTKHTLAGSDKDRKGNPIWTGSDSTNCGPTPKALPALQYEGHNHYAARRHAEYLAHNQIEAGRGISHDQDPTKPLFWAKSPLERLDLSGVPVVGNTKYGGTENVATTVSNYSTADKAYYLTLGLLRSPAHCQPMMHPKVQYVGVGSDEKPFTDSSSPVTLTAVVLTFTGER